MEDQCILITGGSGYLGSKIGSIGNYRIINYDLKNGDDITDIEKIEKIFFENDIRYIIYLAALSDVKSCQDDVNKSILLNTFAPIFMLMTIALKFSNKGYNIGFIFASTSAVYPSDNTSLEPVSETQVSGKIESVYGMTKYITEKAIETLRKNSFIILRFFNIIGEETYSVDRLMVALSRGNVTVYGDDYPTSDGTCVRDYVYVMDCVDAIKKSIKLLEERQNNNTRQLPFCFNIGSGIPMSVKQMIELWKKNKNPDLIVNYGPRRNGDAISVVADNTLAKEYLKWYPTLDFDKIISSITLKE